MTPLLFPHTYITPEMVAAAAHFFPHLRLYQPVAGSLSADLTPWVNSAFLKVHVPVPDEGDKVATAAKEFQQWAQQHKHGRDLRTILPRPDAPRAPFFDDSATAQILTDLKAPPPEDSAHSKSLFNARLFLCLAQDHDQRRREISRQLHQVEAESQALIDELQSIAASETVDANRDTETSLEDSPDYMLSARLKAWAQLYFADTLDRPLLLTMSRSVIVDLVTGSESASVLLQLNSEDSMLSDKQASSASRSSLSARIETACQQGWPFERQLAPADLDVVDAADLTIYLVPNQTLHSIVADLAGIHLSGRIQTHRQPSATKHAVIGLLRPVGS